MLTSVKKSLNTYGSLPAKQSYMNKEHLIPSALPDSFLSSVWWCETSVAMLQSYRSYGQGNAPVRPRPVPLLLLQLPVVNAEGRWNLINLNGSISISLQQKTFFHANNCPKPLFCKLQMAMMVEVSDGTVVEKHFFLLTSSVQSFCFWSGSRKTLKELIYQKKNGGHQASKRVISI